MFQKDQLSGYVAVIVGMLTFALILLGTSLDKKTVQQSIAEKKTSEEIEALDLRNAHELILLATLVTIAFGLHAFLDLDVKNRYPVLAFFILGMSYCFAIWQYIQIQGIKENAGL